MSTTTRSQTNQCASAVDAARAFGVVFGGPLVLDLAALAAVGSTARAFARRERLRAPALLGVAATAAYATAVVSWMRRWGATADEWVRALPGDELVPDPAIESTRAVTIDAPVEAVWPWLAQLGQDRGGFYSYEWLENLAGCRMRNADRIHDEWQHRDVGDQVMLHWKHGVTVARFEPARVLALEGWGAFIVEPIGDAGTRLIARGRTARGLAAVFNVSLVELPHFVMERRMLLGIKRRAEKP
jgi:hypothetical protein